MTINASHLLVFQVKDVEPFYAQFGTAAVRTGLADILTAMDAHTGGLLGRHQEVPLPPSARPTRWWRGFSMTGAGTRWWMLPNRPGHWRRRANDTTDKILYLNRGQKDQLLFEDTAILSGVAWDPNGLPNGSMGVDAADYDASGLPSLLVTNYQNELHALYRNVSEGSTPVFQFSSQSVGLADLGRQYVGFGTGFLDFDLDGWLDIVIANGHVIRFPSGAGVRQLPALLRSLGQKAANEDVRFEQIKAAGGSYFQEEHQGRGLVIGDLDNDGKPDLIVSHVNEPVTLLCNEAKTDHHWLGLELHEQAHGDPVGTRILVETAGRRRTQFAKGGCGYLSSGDRRHLFGLGTASKIEQVTVTWSNGDKQTWRELPVDRYWRLTRDVNEATPVGTNGK